MYKAKSEPTQLALTVITTIVRQENIEPIRNGIIPAALNEKLACFVSIHKTDGSLRGCIGTIEPREKSLYFEIIANAISASLHDSRFYPVTDDELEDITVSVDVLGKPYEINDISELDPSRLGVIVSDGLYNRGVLLPNLEGIDTVEKQLNIAKRKAGLQHTDISMLKIKAFTSTRFH